VERRKSSRKVEIGPEKVEEEIEQMNESTREPIRLSFNSFGPAVQAEAIFEVGAGKVDQRR
jgi:hypothetical protein